MISRIWAQASMTEICLYVQQQWEVCCTSRVELPAIHLRYYGQDGSLERIESAVFSVTDTNTVDTECCQSDPTESGPAVVDPVAVFDNHTTLTPADTISIADTATISCNTSTHILSQCLVYKTTLGRNLFTILKDCTELQEFDKLRYDLKNNKQFTNAHKKRYTKLRKLFEGRVLKRSSDGCKLSRKLLIHEWGHLL